MTNYVNEILEDVLKKLHPGDDVIMTARKRRDEVLTASARYSGCLRTYWSGSLAHRTANFDTDADCGIVLDRRAYLSLGPDGEGEGPSEVINDVRAFLREQLKPEHPDIAFRVTKRAIRVTYGEPLSDGTDPQVDLIVALTRKDPQPGLWIPNIEKAGWDASHPECHTRLLTAEPRTLRQNRARIIRLAKGENVEYSEKAICSFNIEALALGSVEAGKSLGIALAELFEYGADDLEAHETLDPAGVSPPIKTLLKRSIAVKRWTRAGRLVREALANAEDECAVRTSLSQLFPSRVEACPVSDSEMRTSLESGGKLFTVAGFPALSKDRERQRDTRAYGGDRLGAC